MKQILHLFSRPLLLILCKQCLTTWRFLGAIYFADVCCFSSVVCQTKLALYIMDNILLLFIPCFLAFASGSTTVCCTVPLSGERLGDLQAL